METTDLLRRWESGDDESLNELLSQHLEWVRNEVSRRLGSKLKAKLETDDIVGEAVMSFLRYGPRVTPENGDQFRALLVRIVSNQVASEARYWSAGIRDYDRASDGLRSSVVDLSPTPDHIADENEINARVRLAMDFLTTEERELIGLRVIREYTWARVGEVLGCSEDAARMRMNTLEDRLREVTAQLRRDGINPLL